MIVSGISAEAGLNFVYFGKKRTYSCAMSAAGSIGRRGKKGSRQLFAI